MVGIGHDHIATAGLSPPDPNPVCGSDRLDGAPTGLDDARIGGIEEDPKGVRTPIPRYAAIPEV